MSRLLLGLLIVGIFATTARGGEGSVGAGAATIEDFTLTDAQGKAFRLAEESAAFVVVAFLGTECPLVKQYLPLLDQLSIDYPDTRVVGVMSNWLDTKEKVAEFVETHQPRFSILRDGNGELARRFGATRTPEVFLLDATRHIRYQGCIDDRFGIDYRRTQPRQNHLSAAIDDLRAGREVAIPKRPAPGCLISHPPRPKSDSTVTWYGDVLEIFQNRCQECHRPDQAAPFSLMEYEEAAGWAPMIAEVIQQGRMPPWYASDRGESLANVARLTDQERQLIEMWIEQGMPPGDPNSAPMPRRFPEGWLHEPDLVLPMADKPVVIPASGPAYISRFLVQPPWTGGRWIKGVECRPGNRAAVHHLGVFVVAPSTDPLEHWSRRYIDFLYGYSPGILDLDLPPGMAKYVPPGAQLLIELHYVPTGKETTDLSQVGLRFEEADRVTHLVRSHIVVNQEPIEIPPFTPNYVVRGQMQLEGPALLLSMTGHAHVRCKNFVFEASYPAGRRELLLEIPNYDMFWQQLYRLKQPKELPPGTLIHCRAEYDNSRENPRNPDPSATIYDGDENIFQNEMMNGFVFLAERRPRRLPTIADARHLFTPSAPPRMLIRYRAAIALLVVVSMVLIAIGLARWVRSRKSSDGGYASGQQQLFNRLG